MVRNSFDTAKTLLRSLFKSCDDSLRFDYTQLSRHGKIFNHFDHVFSHKNDMKVYNIWIVDNL